MLTCPLLPCFYPSIGKKEKLNHTVQHQTVEVKSWQILWHSTALCWFFSSTPPYSIRYHYSYELQLLNIKQRKLEREVSRRQQCSYLSAIYSWLFKFIPEALCNTGLPLPVPVQRPNPKPSGAFPLP